MTQNAAIKSGERRNATILFADLKGFTALSESMDPEEMDALMTRVFGDFEAIIKAHGGFVEKYIGDALVAVFGVPELHEDDAARAVESALAFLARDREADGSRLSFRIGIHSGLIATGSRGEFQVVTGHAMAMAQRLEEAADPDGVLVSEAVKERCEDDFAFEGPRTLDLKGKRETVDAWALLGRATGALREQGPFVGRQDELDELLRLYVKDDTAAVNGRCVVGEPGIGKTRLVQALVERVQSFPEFGSPVLTAKAQRYRTARYSVVLDLIRAYLGLESGSASQTVAAARKLLPGVDPGHAGGLADLLAPSGPARRDADSLPSLFAVFSAIMEKHESAIYSPFVFIDNVQDMDRASSEFLHYYLKNGRVKPFLVLAGREPPQALRDAFPELKLLKVGPLRDDDAKALVAAHWSDCPDRLLSMILAQSSGNPLFLREYALFARKHKDLSNLPGTVQTMFLSTLERYEPELRDFITTTSVFLHHFTAEDARKLVQATGGERALADRALARFSQDGVLARTEDRYSFAHDVLKKALYASLLNHNKRVLHGIVADIMLGKENPNQQRLIYHLMKAERWLEASEIIRHDPARNYTYEYLDYLDTLYARLHKSSPENAMHLLSVKSAIFFNAGRVDESEHELKRVMRFAVSRKDDESMGLAYHIICAYDAMTYAFQKAQFTGRKALYYYRKAGRQARSIQNVMRHIAFAEMQRHNFEEARSILDDMGAIGERDDFEYRTAVAEYRLLSGDYRGALESMEGLGMPCDDSGAVACDDSGYGAVARFFGADMRLKVLWQLCDYPAIGPAARALLDAGDLSDTSTAQAYAMMAAAAALSGDDRAAREGFMQAEYYAEKVRNDFDRIDSLRTLALAHYITGNVRKAEAAAREALVLGLRHSAYYPSFTVVMLLTQIAAGRGDEEEARFFLREASYFFMTGLLLPYKDAIVYYYYAGRLLDPGSIERTDDIAKRLLEDEKARIGDPARIAAFLSVRGFGDIQRNLDRIGGL